MKWLQVFLFVFLSSLWKPYDVCAAEITVKDSTRSYSRKCHSQFDSLSKREIYLFADTMPRFPGGMKAMMSFIANNLSYPREGCSFQTTVFIAFIVETDGTITGKRILNSFNKYVDKEAMRVIEKMPLWQPGSCNGTFVPVQFQVPVRFRIR